MRTVTLYTGIGGYWMFNWALAKEAGLPLDGDTRTHKLVKLLLYRHRAIADNGEVWMFTHDSGKTVWKNLHQLAPTKRQNPRESRFNQWEQTLSL